MVQSGEKYSLPSPSQHSAENYGHILQVAPLLLRVILRKANVFDQCSHNNGDQNLHEARLWQNE